MTHRERFIASISHKQPDRVPIDLGGTRDSSIVIEGYEKLKRHFGVEDNNNLSDMMMQVAVVDENILKKFDIDMRAVFPGAPVKNNQEFSKNKYIDMWGVERVKPENGYYFDQIKYPLSGNISTADVISYQWPDPDDPGFTMGLKERIAWIKNNTDCAIVLSLPSPFVHTSQYLRGFEDWFCDLLINTGVTETLFDTVLDINMRIAENVLKEAGKDADVIICADDLGTQAGLQISKELYLKYIKPRHMRFFRQIHDLSSAKFLFHSCGSLEEIMDDLIDIGVDILNPVQTTAKGMDSKNLKKRYGKKLSFWGAMDTQRILPFGTVREVKRMVEKLIEDLGEGGGFVLGPCHNIQPDVTVDNIIAMYEHARQYVPSYMK
jgi:uroporphyrinogen decarboxylase